MLDRQTEALYYPQALLQLDAIESVLCVAPHPDDEVLACGGLLTQLAGRRCRINTLILSRGERAGAAPAMELAQVRQQESLSAARVLGLPAPRFHDFADRELVYAQPLIAAIGAALDQCRPQYLLLPSLSEPHPDHQAVALAGMAAAQRSPYPQTLLFYEVGAPLQPNLFVDISAVAALKWRAVAEFVSQLGIESYDTHARAFANLRAFGLGPACTQAEAFFRVDGSELRQQGAAAALPQWPLIRAQHRLANSPQQLPLVSVLIRSVDRPQLTEAIASVAVQTYSNIEIVVVNASGRDHGAIQYPRQRLSLQLLEPDRQAGCGRARAANLALRAARGELAIFLDDDDLLAPEHIERLVAALAVRPMVIAAYAGVRVEGVGGAFQRNYDLPWSRYRIRGINYLPIHAVMFRLDRVRSSDLAFDESLPVLEDWDFWCKLATLSDFFHCPGVSAVYRQGHGESGLGEPEHANHWKTWHARLIERYAQRSSTAELSQTLAWHAVELDRVQASAESAERRIEQPAKESLAALQAREQLEQFSRESQAALQAKQAELEQFSRESQAALQAKQAELEQFSRESQAALQAKQAELEQFSRESQAALQAKDRQLEDFARESQAALQAKQAELEQFSRESQAALHSLQSTLSWRVTAPFRKVGEWLRSMRA